MVWDVPQMEKPKMDLTTLICCSPLPRTGSDSSESSHEQERASVLYSQVASMASSTGHDDRLVF